MKNNLRNSHVHLTNIKKRSNFRKSRNKAMVDCLIAEREKNRKERKRWQKKNLKVVSSIEKN